MSSFEKEPLYYLNQCIYFRLNGDAVNAHLSIDSSRSLIPKHIEHLKHHNTILLCCGIEKSILDSNYEALSGFTAGFIHPHSQEFFTPGRKSIISSSLQEFIVLRSLSSLTIFFIIFLVSD